MPLPIGKLVTFVLSGLMEYPWDAGNKDFRKFSDSLATCQRTRTPVGPLEWGPVGGSSGLWSHWHYSRVESETHRNLEKQQWAQRHDIEGQDNNWDNNKDNGGRSTRATGTTGRTSYPPHCGTAAGKAFSCLHNNLINFIINPIWWGEDPQRQPFWRFCGYCRKCKCKCKWRCTHRKFGGGNIPGIGKESGSKNGGQETGPIAMPVTCPMPNLHWHKSNAPFELTMESLHANELTPTRSNPRRNSQQKSNVSLIRACFKSSAPGDKCLECQCLNPLKTSIFLYFNFAFSSLKGF